MKMSHKNIFIIYFKDKSSNTIQGINMFVVKNTTNMWGKVRGSRWEQQA